MGLDTQKIKLFQAFLALLSMDKNVKRAAGKAEYKEERSHVKHQKFDRLQTRNVVEYEIYKGA